MEQIRCECGHENPYGTEICQSCGKPFDNKQDILNMRYEGVARRSQTYNKSLVDSIWNFFASVRVGMTMLFILLVASILGTIYPQQMYIPQTVEPLLYYEEQYGQLGYLYALLGFHNLYGSWWYITLLVLIGISITIASIDRFIPLYRSLKRQGVRRHPSFMSRQRIFGKSEVDHPEKVMHRVKAQLQKQRYRVREEDGALLGEKARFNRWGPYVVHVGLIILLIGALIRIMPGVTMEEYMWIRDGETVPVPGTDRQFYVKSEGFDLDVYDETSAEEWVPEEFRTEAVLYENVAEDKMGEPQLEEIKRQTIKVNQPLKHDTLKLYQSDFILNEFSEFSFHVKHKQSGDILGEVTVDLYQPQSQYDLGGGNKVELIEYYPDFELDENQQPATKSNIPNNPAFIFEVTTPHVPEGEHSWIFVGQKIEAPGNENQYELSISDVQFNNVSGLMVREERVLPIIYTGLGIAMIGLMMCYYWQHRRIWIQQEGNEIWLAAHTHKNWYGMQKEVVKLIESTELMNPSHLKISKDFLDKEE